MKKAFLSILLLIFTAGVAHAQNIRVLILDGNFTKKPAEGEALRKLDSLKGELLIGYTSYRGAIEVWQGAGGLYLVNELPIEDYVEGVVMSEVSETWDTEALKVQAVIARTYAVYLIGQNGEKTYHLTSNVMDQLFKGAIEETRITKAVKATRGQVLTFQGEPIKALYHSTCGGKTEDAAEVFGAGLPYLRPVKTACNLSPFRIWTRRIPLQDIAGIMNVPGLSDIKVKSLTASGRAADVALIAGSNHTVKATELRKSLGWKRLPSTDFTVRVAEGAAIFEGRGWGHGVGLCQYGALEMARAGKAYKEILSTYYPGTLLEVYDPERF